VGERKNQNSMINYKRSGDYILNFGTCDKIYLSACGFRPSLTAAFYVVSRYQSHGHESPLCSITWKFVATSFRWLWPWFDPRDVRYRSCSAGPKTTTPARVEPLALITSRSLTNMHLRNGIHHSRRRPYGCLVRALPNRLNTAFVVKVLDALCR
jgi:hypothetical protein